MTSIHEVLGAGAVRSVFQPILDLDTGQVVAYEALARGPQGPLERPDLLFAAARAAGCLAELDEACRLAAFRGGRELGLFAPLALFVNVEPEVLDSAPLEDLLEIAARADGALRVVLEITERALAARPAELLRTVERVRELGWGVALDDVGAESLSLAFMPLLRPDVVKLDLTLVQERPGPAVAQIMNAVNAYAESSGAVVLAEGIENAEHLAVARALGARLGQGWLFGRPLPHALPGPIGELVLPPAPETAGEEASVSPFSCLPRGVALRRSPKSLLIELSKQLEREAMRLGETCVVAATFQESRHFTPGTAQRYRDLVERTGFVCALGEGLPVEPVPGVRGATLAPGDPVRSEWDLVVLSPHFSAALLARDLGDEGPDLEREFAFALTYERDTVVRAARSLLSRVVPRSPDPRRSAAPAPARAAATALPRGLAGLHPAGDAGQAVLHSALAATTSGIAVADLQLPDSPLVYVNRAFEELSGLPAEQVLGRNCRFLQGPDTDPAALDRVRAALAAGRSCSETLLNYRGPQRTEWWNQVDLVPVHAANGRVVQYIGVQNDVSARIAAERALQQERDRAQAQLAQLEQRAGTDPLTGLPSRAQVQERVETALWDARIGRDAVALVFLDLDGFQAVNDRLGYVEGDELLLRVAERLRSRLRRRDLLARLWGDEFLVVLPGLDPAGARAEAELVAATLVTEVAALRVGGATAGVGASAGVGVHPEDGQDFAQLLQVARVRMSERKRAAGPRVRLRPARPRPA